MMANLNASRNKVMKTREELQLQIEQRRQEREMKKQAQLDEERFEGEMNQQELKAMQERNQRLRMEKKEFVSESLRVGTEKKTAD